MNSATAPIVNRYGFAYNSSGMKYIAAFAPVCALVLLTACRPSPEKLLATANKYHDNKKYKEASILYQKVLAKDKKNAEAYYREGLNLIDQGTPFEAAQFLRRAVDLNPSNLDARAKLAEIYLTAYMANPQRFKTLLPQVEDMKTKILQQDPNSFDGLRLQAILYLAAQKKSEALATFAKANQIRPHSRQLIGWYAQALVSADQTPQAEALVRDMLAHDKTWGPGYDFLYVTYKRENEPQKAEAVLRSRVQNDPKSAVAILNLSNYLVTTNRYGEAEALMKKTLDDKAAFPAAHEMLGDFYARTKKYDAAIEQYQEGAREDKKRELSYNQRIVTAYALMGRRADALHLAQSLAAKNPKDTTSNEMYASLLLETGLQSDAKKSLTELTSLSKNNPTNPMLHLDLARAYLLTNDATRALSEDLEALQLEAKSHAPRNTVLIPGRIIASRIYESRGQHAQALEQSEQVLKLQDGNPEARLMRDQALIGLSESDQALPDLVKLVQQYPQLNDARLALGNLYLVQKNYSQAADQFQHVWTANPPDSRGFIGLQQVKIFQGKTGDAVKAMEDLVSRNPKIPGLRYELANFQANAGQELIKSNPDKAKSYFQQAADNYKLILKTNVNSPEIWVRLGILQRVLGQNEPALASFEQATNADPKSIPALVNRGMLLDALGRKKDAADIYNKILGIDPNNALALNNLAFLNADSGTNLDQAMTFAERAKKQAPKSDDVSDTLGYVYFRKNLNAAALQIFEQNVQDQPQNPTFHLHLAMALLKKGDKQGARSEAEKALKTATPAQQQQIQSFVNQIG
jgi:tetratricopeptide (TPR) repeat protein